MSIDERRAGLHLDAISAACGRLTRALFLADAIDRYQIENIDDNLLGYAATMLVEELRAAEREQGEIQSKIAALDGNGGAA